MEKGSRLVYKGGRKQSGLERRKETGWFIREKGNGCFIREESNRLAYKGGRKQANL